MLASFRAELYGCLTAQADALFELNDAVLCTDGPVRTLICRRLLSTGVGTASAGCETLGLWVKQARQAKAGERRPERRQCPKGSTPKEHPYPCNITSKGCCCRSPKSHWAEPVSPRPTCRYSWGSSTSQSCRKTALGVASLGPPDHDHFKGPVPQPTCQGGNAHVDRCLTPVRRLLRRLPPCPAPHCRRACKYCRNRSRSVSARHASTPPGPAPSDHQRLTRRADRSSPR